MTTDQFIVRGPLMPPIGGGEAVPSYLAAYSSSRHPRALRTATWTGDRASALRVSAKEAARFEKWYGGITIETDN